MLLEPPGAAEFVTTATSLSAIERNLVPVADPEAPRLQPTDNSDSRWLIHFGIIAIVAGLVAILFITIFYRL